MRKTLLATALVAVAVASPAAARDGSPYAGIEGGILFPKDQTADINVDFVDPLATDTSFNNGLGIEYKRGLDVDGIVGYDFGPLRLEGELGLKRAKLDKLDVSSGLSTATGLTDFDLNGKARVLSGMVNLLGDFEVGGFGVYAGAGVGRARVKFAGDKDSAWAGQLLAGVRTALSENVDLGLKYRYFRTRKLGFNGGSTPFFDDTGTTPVQLGTVATDFEQRFRSHSVLASLIFNFGAPAEAAPPPPPPPVETPPPPPPQTQTCPDGSVILATDQCPAPPPPPPPPAPAPERG